MMSMEISNRYGLDYIHKAQTEQTAKATERAEEAAKSKEKDKPEYISSEKSGKKPSGLYHMEQDKNGNPKIIFDTAKKAEEAANALFTGKGDTSNMPTAKIDENSTILDAIIAAGFAPSKGQARTLIMQGGIMLGDEKISDTNYKITNEMLSNELILKKGKKGFCKLVKK